jgi:small subunit ribosomal protein S11
MTEKEVSPFKQYLINYKLDNPKRPKLPKKRAIITVKCSFNNTIITLADLNGNTKAFCSCGSIGFKNGKRSIQLASKAVGEHIGHTSETLGYNVIKLNYKGVGKGRYSFGHVFKKHRLKLKEIKDVSPLAHNGCRSQKLRRL